MFILTFASLIIKLIGMKFINALIIFVLLTHIFSCSGGKQIAGSIENGNSLYASGNYADALGKFEEAISWYEQNDRQKECPVYAEAAKAAIVLKQTEKAIAYLKKDQYSDFATADTYFNLAGLYREIDNLSKELDELEAYKDKYPEGDKIMEVNSRLFDAYVESENYQQAITSWDQLSETDRNNLSKIESYFKVNTALDNDSICNQLAEKLIKVDENNLIALDYLGKKFFWKAENRYHAELKAYEKKKTNKQYNKLLKALDVVSTDFKKSLGYFKKLYKIHPEPKTAKYMGNIYNRLDDKKKADYYYKLAE